MTIDVTHPWMLLLAAALPALWWIVRRTLTDFSRAQRRVMLVLRSLIVVSDDNFSRAQRTAFLAFAINE